MRGRAIIGTACIILAVVSMAFAGSPTTAAQSTQPTTNSHGTQTNIVPPDVAQLLIDAAKDPSLSSEFLIECWNAEPFRLYLAAQPSLTIVLNSNQVVFGRGPQSGDIKVNVTVDGEATSVALDIEERQLKCAGTAVCEAVTAFLDRTKQSEFWAAVRTALKANQPPTRTAQRK